MSGAGAQRLKPRRAASRDVLADALFTQPTPGGWGYHGFCRTDHRSPACARYTGQAHRLVAQDVDAFCWVCGHVSSCHAA